MAATKIANILVPEVWVPYVIERTAELSELVKSGIVVPDASLDILAQKGGKLIEMPFFTDLSGNDEVLSDSSSLTVNNIATAKDQARLFMRGKAWGVNDLAKALSGADPMKAIADLVASYWNRREQALLLAVLKGVFADNAANDSGDLVKDIAGEETTTDESKLIGASTMIDALGKLGDAAEKLTAMIMHSVPFQRLQKLQLIEWVAAGSTATKLEAGSQDTTKVPTFLGKRVIVDDTCPVAAGSTSGYKYTTYLFGQGAIGRGEGSAPVPVETDRDSLAGEDYLIHRRHFVLHPRGIKWTEASVAGSSPTNTEAETASNWDRVYEKKNIRIVKFVTNG